MDDFHFVDIFATKGIAYLIVIAFLVWLPLVWRFLNRPARRGRGQR